MTNETQDLNAQETGENQSGSKETASSGSEALQNSEEIEAKAESLLKDGTSPKKNITIPKEKYDELRGVEEFMKGHAPLIEKVRKNPELVEELLGKEAGSDLEERLARLEEERKVEKRNELKQAILEALSQYPDFEKSWPEIQPIANSIKGLPYREALRRAYLAVHPEAAQAEAERIAKEGANKQGTFSLGSSYPVNVGKIQSARTASDVERKVAKQLGYKNVEEYVELTSKYEEYGREHGWFTPA